MLDDNLTKAMLAEMVGEERFEAEEAFKTAMRPKIQEALFLDTDRIGREADKNDKRFDLFVYDSMTRREAVVMFGFKVLALTPSLSPEDIQKFQEKCKKIGVAYGVLLTETEYHIYEFKDGQVKEVEEIPPLNHVDYEFNRVMTPQKWKDYLMARKKWVVLVGGVILLIIASSLAQGSICKSSGPIKGEVNSSDEKSYYLPESSGYANRVTGDREGERRFCEENDAIDQGFTLAK